ncbi:formylglycine-generating enzyme family protein [Sorangium sp. So ce1153]|uniref:formylglycine-generating enzyme family protein n=1 Tax=Sorangium sp. So ce1153 TaxID=3133333 RepID=UPI003F628927
MCTGECGPEDVRCSENRPQRCDDRGAWADVTPCPAAAPVCRRGACVTPPSCVGLAETCGPDRDESCCATTAVPAGTFNRSNDPAYPATVSGFLLDRFEVSVGRFRKFVEAYPGSRPAVEAGAHPLINGSGWDANWDSNLPADEAALRRAINCSADRQAWTEGEGNNELLPMNCLSWYVAFAFCAWDSGRLPTEAEWNYAAAGGSEQRAYPWSSPPSDETIDPSYAVYHCTGDGSAAVECAFRDILSVGSRSPKGDGKWGQSDLAGSMWEWALDWHAGYMVECDNCANTTVAMSRVIRGGGWDGNRLDALSTRRTTGGPTARVNYVGVRCARTP